MTNLGTEAYLLVVCVCEGTINKEPEKYSMLHGINVLEKEKTRSKKGSGGHCSCKQFGNMLTFAQRSVGSEGVSHAVMCSQCKGPEAGANLLCSRI